LFGLRSDFYIKPGVSVYMGIDNKLFPTSSGSIELADVPFYQVSVESGFIWSK